jgi:undecaprenyl-diphosphatase
VDLISAALLGVVQGLTEFLPVSSSGHLILARAFFGWDPGRFGIPFDAACHVGTLLAVVAFFRAEVGALITAAPGALSGKDGEWERLGRLIIVGTIPIVIVGGLFGDLIEARIRTPLIVAVNLVLGSVLLLWVERVGRQTRDARTLGYGEALAIGIAQAAALAPGLSRSGLTLSVALFIGLARGTAARFVFLMSLPAVLAVAIKEANDLYEIGMAGIPVTLLLVGLVTSAVVGYVTVKYFIKYLAAHSLDVFAYYRLALAAVTFVWLLTRSTAWLG